jgi:hypothetical protein
MRRIFSAFGVVVAVAIVLGCVTPAELHAAPVRVVGHHDSGSSFVSNNWAGYVAQGGPYASVSATWIQPAIPAVGQPSTEVAFWVGLDGGPGSTKSLEQLGTSAAIDAKGRPYYYAWWEMIPKPSVPIRGFSVTPGDVIQATVTNLGDGSFALEIDNLSTAQSFLKIARNGVTASTTAEIIVERVTAQVGTKQSLFPFAYCGTVLFTECSIDDHPLEAAVPTRFNLLEPAQDLLALPSSIEATGTSFYVFSPSMRPVTAVSGPLGVWYNTPVDLTFTAFSAAAAPAVKATELRVDDAPWSIGQALTVTAPADHSNDGLHMIRFRSIDHYLNYENAKTRMVGIDTLGPVGAARSLTATRGRASQISYAIRDATSPELTWTLQILKDGSVVKEWPHGLLSAPTPKGVWWSQRFWCDLPAGDYRIRVIGTDLAGNDQSVAGSASLRVKGATGGGH